jgi:deoxyribonuclease-4
MKNETRFGTSGNPPNFFKSKFGDDRKNAIDWIDSIRLNAYEYMMTYGARTKEEKAKYLAQKSKQLDVEMSVHAPYYVVLTSDKQKVVENSIKEMIKTLRLAELMNSKKVIFHPGFNSKNALLKCTKGLQKIMRTCDNKMKILPETMGKLSQLGSLKDVITICGETGCLPCIDFGHLHARSLGGLKEKEDFRKIITEIEKKLGKSIIKNLHCHFYPVEFTGKGEKRHRAVTEKNVFPKFEQFAPIIKEFNMNPTLISESRDSQDIGALQMKEILTNLR